jgi:MFS superfamily sulfate permease-like transporter
MQSGSEGARSVDAKRPLKRENPNSIFFSVMVSVFLAVTAGIVAAMVLGCVTMMFIYFSNPDDKEESIFPKIVVVRQLHFHPFFRCS